MGQGVQIMFEIKRHHKKCTICGEDFFYEDVREDPETCGRLMCRENLKYQDKIKGHKYGERMDPDRIKKW